MPEIIPFAISYELKRKIVFIYLEVAYWLITLYKFHVYSIVCLYFCVQCSVLTTTSLVSIHHRVPALQACPPLTPFPIGNHSSVFCVYKGFLYFVHLFFYFLSIKLCFRNFYLWLHWVPVAAQSVLCSCDVRASHCSGLSCSWARALGNCWLSNRGTWV